MKKKTFLSLILLNLFLVSCSLDYSQNNSEESKAPEFIFNDLTITKIENGIQTAEVKGETLEQYRDEEASYAKNITFKLYTNNKLIKLEGNCGFLSVDNKNDIYSLFDQVNITSYEQNMIIQANCLKWNNKSEQLTSSLDDEVIIKNNITSRDDSKHVKANNSTNSEMTISGKGFAASGVTQTYSFSNTTSGQTKSQSVGSNEKN